MEKVKIDVVGKLKKEISFDDGILWLMGVEAVNLSKEPITGYQVTSELLLIDEDDFKFSAISVADLGSTDFGKSVGLRRFFGWSDMPKLMPKIKATGAIPYLLPDDEAADYSFSVKDGNIREI